MYAISSKLTMKTLDVNDIIPLSVLKTLNLLTSNTFSKKRKKKKSFYMKDFFCKCEQIRSKPQICSHLLNKTLTLTRRRSLEYWNQSIDLLCKSKDWFLCDKDLCHERVENYFLCDDIISGRVFPELSTYLRKYLTFV